MPSIDNTNLNLPTVTSDAAIPYEENNNTSNTANNTPALAVSNTTSEDSLVSLEEEDSKTSKSTSAKTGLNTSSGNATLDGLYMQQQSETKRMEQLQKRIAKRTKDLSDLKKRLTVNKNLSDKSKSSIQTNIGKVESDISSLNSELSKCQSNLSTIASNITQTIQNINTQAIQNISAQATQNASVQQTNNVQGAGLSTSTYAGIPVTTIPADLAQRIDNKLGAGFCAKVEEVSAKLNCNPNDLLAMMYSESGLDPHYYASDGTVGLISLLSDEVREHGQDPAQIAAMSGIEQMDIVYQYMMEAKTTVAEYGESDPLDAGTLYAINYVPAWAKNEVLCSKFDDTAWAYEPNYPLDVDGDGIITKTDMANTIVQQFQELQQYF